ncbi:MAG: PKD domain-containing protein [Gallionellaceae bacterium]|nr:PKD domain-containing protein [Gallionellaceae bacterium]
MKILKLFPSVCSLLAAVLGVAAMMVSVGASAHTVKICWKDVGPVTTFYAGTYHSPTEGPSPIGGIILDGFTYPFSGWVYPAALPAGIQCAAASTSPNGNPPAVIHYQTFTSSFAGGAHTVSFTATNVVQAPWGAFPTLTFGGGACADADFDGICNDVDACPLDFSNDADGDGICGNVDNCPLNYNPTQTDANHNGQGDVCEGVVCGNGLLQGSEQCDDGNIAGGDGCSAICTFEIADSPPNANAGMDQSVNEVQTVTLDGTASNDPDGDTLSYAWVQVGGTAVALSGASTSQPSFTSPTVAVGGETLTFELTVTANGLSDVDQVSIAVVNVNHTPVADAGIDLSIAEGSPVALDGTNSFDIDSDSITYAWVQESGPTVTITGANTASPSFTAPIGGMGGVPGVVASLVFKLTVDDGLPQNAPPSGYTFANVEDTVTVSITNVNNLPVADAGMDMTLNENSAVQMNGSASSDPDSDALTYAWVQVGGTVVALSGSTTTTPSFTTPFVSAGGEDLTFKLTVDDGYGGTATDTTIIHVQNANDPPLVSAAQPTISCMWPPNHKLVAIGIIGVSDPEDNATITIDSVTQDEVTNGLGDGDTAVDAVINADGTVLLRAERSGRGDGRMYHVHFTASDLEGSASGVVNVCVQHNSKSPAIDGGELYDSTQ